MLLKSADDKSKRLTLLDDLQCSQMLDSFQRKWLYDEFMRLEKEIQGEAESADYINQYFKEDSKNYVILHDLRFVIEGEVTHIDHLIITRASNIYLLETKNYPCNFIINAHGEFTTEYEGVRLSIRSPLEQSQRHERVLCKFFEHLSISGRTQKLPEFYHVVMLHPHATIERPASKVFDTSNVIKVDELAVWHKNFSDQSGFHSLLKNTLNRRSTKTIKEWGEKIMQLHRPADLLALPDFMRPGQPTPLTKAPAY